MIVAAGRDAGLSFEASWEVAAIAALGYMGNRRAREWAEVLDGTVHPWDDAYHGRRSPLQALPREVPAALGYVAAARRSGFGVSAAG